MMLCCVLSTTAQLYKTQHRAWATAEINMISHPHNPLLCGVNEETQSHCNALCPQHTRG